MAIISLKTLFLSCGNKRVRAHFTTAVFGVDSNVTFRT